VHGFTLLLADGLVGPKKKSGALGEPAEWPTKLIQIKSAHLGAE
jgi:hypothetical protein